MFKRLLSIGALLLSFAFVVLLMPSALAATDNDSSQNALRAGVTAFEQGNYRAASEEFTQAIEQNPHAAYSNRCLAYLLLNEHRSAIADCTQAVNLDPTSSEPYLNRGLAHYRVGNYQEAIANYTQLLQLQPQDFRAYYNRGLAQFAIQNYAAAIADYAQSLNWSSSDQLAEIYGDRGIAYLMLGNHQQAIADCTQAIVFKSSSGQSFV